MNDVLVIFLLFGILVALVAITAKDPVVRKQQPCCNTTTEIKTKGRKLSPPKKKSTTTKPL